MTTPNQQPEVSAEAREAAEACIRKIPYFHSIIGTQYQESIGVLIGEFIQRAIDRTTEKLRDELAEWKQAAEIEAKCHDETNARCDQLRAENEALQATITACEHEVATVYTELTENRFSKMNTRASAILDRVREIHDEETRAIRDENEALRKVYGTMTTLLEVQEGELSSLRKDRERLNWLEKFGGYAWGQENQNPTKPYALHCIDFDWTEGDDMRAAIDAAMAGKK